MNGLLYKYHLEGIGKNEQTISIPGSKNRTPTGQGTPLNKIYSPDDARNNQYLNDQVTNIL